MTATQSAPTTRRRWGVVAGVTVVVIVIAALAYYAAGWQRMDSACSSDAAVPQGANADSVAFAWSWAPPGFACTWDGADGEPVTVVKLWW